MLNLDPAKGFAWDMLQAQTQQGMQQKHPLEMLAEALESAQQMQLKQKSLRQPKTQEELNLLKAQANYYNSAAAGKTGTLDLAQLAEMDKKRLDFRKSIGIVDKNGVAIDEHAENLMGTAQYQEAENIAIANAMKGKKYNATYTPESGWGPWYKDSSIIATPEAGVGPLDTLPTVPTAPQTSNLYTDGKKLYNNPPAELIKKYNLKKVS